MVARSASKLEGPWSRDEMVVRSSGNPESPFVLQRGAWYYLWQQMSVYRSTDPTDFNDAELVQHMTGVWFEGKFAPEVIDFEGEQYLAAYTPGLWVAKLKWEWRTPAEVAKWREQWLKYLAEEHRKLAERRKLRESNGPSVAPAHD